MWRMADALGEKRKQVILSASSCDEATIETRKRFLGAKRSGTMAEACTRSFAAVSVQNIVPTGWFLFPKDDAAWLDTRRDQQLLSLALYCLKSPTRQCSGYFSSHLADRCVECTVHVGDREQVESSSRFFAEAEQSSATSTALLSQYCKLRFYETATWLAPLSSEQQAVSLAHTLCAFPRARRCHVLTPCSSVVGEWGIQRGSSLSFTYISIPCSRLLQVTSPHLQQSSEREAHGDQLCLLPICNVPGLIHSLAHFSHSLRCVRRLWYSLPVVLRWLHTLGDPSLITRAVRYRGM